MKIRKIDKNKCHIQSKNERFGVYYGRTKRSEQTFGIMLGRCRHSLIDYVAFGINFFLVFLTIMIRVPKKLQRKGWFID